jgi:peptide deformylase
VVRPVVRFPDPRLKAVCRRATPAEARRVAADLIDTMRAHPRCWGMAAPQIGESVRVAVVDVRGHGLADAHNGLLVLVNAVVAESAGSQVAREGCLSLPALTADVKRARRVLVAGESVDGHPVEFWAGGFEARVVQHELDHLDGFLILDRVTSVRALHPRLLAGREGSTRPA